MKTYKLLCLSLVLVIVLSACGLAANTAEPTLQGTTAQIQLIRSTPRSEPVITDQPTFTVSVTPTVSNATPFPANTPVWVIYTYTCALMTGGSNMTMNLSWSDRSSTEDGYIVYRDKKAIATLAPNSTSYVDVSFVAPGKTLSYSVEAFTSAWRTSTSVITYGCQ